MLEISLYIVMISQPEQNLRDEQVIRLQRFQIQYISKQEKEEAQTQKTEGKAPLQQSLVQQQHVWY
jgi:hypothetical protein